MNAVRLHGPRDLRIDSVPDPGPPQPGEVLLRVTAVGICGSDLHTYRHARIGDTQVSSPLILGHEFAGVVERGEDARDGMGALLAPGTRVAVDPAIPCGLCEMCGRGQPNLCQHLRFCGLSPDDGSLRQRMIVPGRNCFPLPASIDDVSGALLEPLGIALHAIRLARLQPGESVSIHGAGPIGLLILQVVLLTGGSPVYVVERLPWRRRLAERLGGVPVHPEEESPARVIQAGTGGRGVDVAFEAGWADSLVQEAADAVRPGGRIVLVGIPENDVMSLRHSTARRKGLTLLFSRRMKHTYPRAIELVENGRVDVASLVSHRFPLQKAPDAFDLNERYADGVVKVMIVV